MDFFKDTHIHLENKKVSRIFFVFIWILYALVYMTKNCFSGALAIIVEEGALTLTEASIISGSFYVAYTPLQVLGGVFADKYSPEKLITVGLIGSAAANIVIFFNQSFIVMLLAWIFNAIIQFGLWPAVYKIITSQLVRSDRSEMIFFITFASSGGLILTYAVSALIPSWEYNFAISAAILLLLALLLFMFCKHINPLIKRDKIPDSPLPNEQKGERKHGVTTARLFLVSGFFVMLPAVIFRQIVESGTKSLSSTMLSQSYENISPVLGNVLNALIIAFGIIGIVLVKVFVFPSLIKSELAAAAVLLSLSLPFSVILFFVGTLDAVWIVVALCALSLFISPIYMLLHHYNLHFGKYGMGATVSGILNAAASLAFVLQFFILGPLAENLGWQTVMAVWIAMLTLTLIFILIALRPFNRFKCTENTEKI